MKVLILLAENAKQLYISDCYLYCLLHKIYPKEISFTNSYLCSTISRRFWPLMVNRGIPSALAKVLKSYNVNVIGQCIKSLVDSSKQDMRWWFCIGRSWQLEQNCKELLDANSLKLVLTTLNSNIDTIQSFARIIFDNLLEFRGNLVLSVKSSY